MIFQNNVSYQVSGAFGINCFFNQPVEFIFGEKIMKRKLFLRALTGTGLGLSLLPNHIIAQTTINQEIQPYPIDLVKEFVIAGHGNFDKVKTMLADHPNLIYSKFDWGNGDFEAAIEGAGHVGNKEIAHYLLDSGSRVTLFILTMLGKTELVKPILETYPKLISAIGPHGFTMLHHAKAGGSDGEPLYAYLQEKGLKETWIKIK